MKLGQKILKDPILDRGPLSVQGIAENIGLTKSSPSCRSLMSKAWSKYFKSEPNFERSGPDLVKPKRNHYSFFTNQPYVSKLKNIELQSRSNGGDRVWPSFLELPDPPV